VADLTEEQLLHLVDRAESGSLLAAEAVALRAGIRSLAAARRSLGGVQAKQQRERQDADAAPPSSTGTFIVHPDPPHVAEAVRRARRGY
jgi:hypothetical protein